MDKYVCTICGYVYDPEEGCEESEIEPGTLWQDLPDDFVCPLCGMSMEDFIQDND